MQLGDLGIRGDFTSGWTVHEIKFVLSTFLTVLDLSLFGQVCKIVKEQEDMSLMLIAVGPEVKASSYEEAFKSVIRSSNMQHCKTYTVFQSCLFLVLLVDWNLGQFLH